MAGTETYIQESSLTLEEPVRGVSDFLKILPNRDPNQERNLSKIHPNYHKFIYQVPQM